MSPLPGASGRRAGFVEQVSTPPTFPVSISATTTTITLSWVPLPFALSYNVYCGLSPQSMLPQTDNLTGSTFTIQNLVPGQTYYVQVLAELSARRAVAGVFPSGSGAQTGIGQVTLLTTPPRDLTWQAISVPSGGALSDNLLLASIYLPSRSSGARNYAYTQTISDSDPIGYVEIQAFNIVAGQNPQASTQACISEPGNPPSVMGAIWQADNNGVPTLYYNSDNDDITQAMVAFPNGVFPFPSVIGLIVDSPNLHWYLSYNGQFWDPASQTLQSSYTTCKPGSLNAGGRTIDYSLSIAGLS